MSNEPGFANDSSERIRRRILATSLLSLLAIDVRDEYLAANRLERRAHLRRAGERSAAQQRLVLPNPSVLRLIVAKPLEARDEQARPAARTQPRVDLVQAARARLNR